MSSQATYRNYLHTLNTERLLREAVNVWNVHNPDILSRDELIEKLVGLDEAVELGGTAR